MKKKCSASECTSSVDKIWSCSLVFILDCSQTLNCHIWNLSHVIIEVYTYWGTVYNSKKVRRFLQVYGLVYGYILKVYVLKIRVVVITV